METAFDRDTAVLRQGPQDAPTRAADALPGASDTAHSTFLAEVSPDWRAGRGPHGGYIAAMILKALIGAIDDPARSPRSLTIHYASAPAPGPALIHVTVERAGRSLSTLSARLEQDGKPVALALAAFSVPWKAEEVNHLPMPELPGPDADRHSSAGLFKGAPPFTRQLALQPRVGAVPFQGSEVPMELGGWIGLNVPRALDAPAVALYCDAWFPPPFIALKEPAVSPTVDLTIHFRRPINPDERDPEELCLSIFRARLLHEGFFEEDGIVWGADGEVLAQSRQLALIIPVAAPGR